jgi:predicted Fe-Mo cluster-binding NifX family protein
MAHPSFGRASVFVFVDAQTGAMEAVRNEPGAHGAGVQAAQTVADQGAKIVVTGSVGPNAFRGLSAAGIRVFTGASGSVKEAFDAYKRGDLSEAKAPNAEPHQRSGR